MIPIPIATLNFYRVLFAALFLGVTVPLFSRGEWSFPTDNKRDVAVVGLLIALQISFFNLAMTMAPIANVVVLWSVAPFFVFIFSTLFLNERPRLVHVFIFLIAITGIVIARPLHGGMGDMVVWGNLIALFDGAIYAAMVTYLRNEETTESENDMFWFMAAATVILAPSVYLFGPGDLMTWTSAVNVPFAAPALVWAVCLGVISTGFAFFFISVVLADVDANIYSLVDIITSPILAAAFGYLVFSEVPSTNMVYGGILLLASGFWLTREMSKKSPKHSYSSAQRAVK